MIFIIIIFSMIIMFVFIALAAALGNPSQPSNNQTTDESDTLPEDIIHREYFMDDE